MQTNKMIVAVGLSKDLPNIYSALKGVDFTHSKEVHLVHVFQTITYTYGLGNYSLIYPLEDDRKQVEEKTVETLKKISQEILPPNFTGKVVYHCFFADSPKDKFTEYANEQKADLIVVPTRKKRGLFESSFAQYVQKHTSSNILMVKSL